MSTHTAAMVVPQGSFSLTRPHEPASSPLRAWDAADVYLLEHLDGLALQPANVVVVNDTFGALATALAVLTPQSWSDSVVTHDAVQLQLEANGAEPDSVVAVPSTTDPVGPIDLVVLKIPKSSALLIEQLTRLRPLLAPDAVVIAGGMTKNVHSSTIAEFERILGPTPTSLAKRKARLLLPTIDAELTPRPIPEPHRVTTPWGAPATAMANVFSRRRIDEGTQFLLDNLPKEPPLGRVVDAGCGSGLLGTAAAVQDLDADIVFVDVSYQAVASAQCTFEAACDPNRSAIFDAADGLHHLDEESIDLVLSNPPFHAAGARGDQTAWRLFTGAYRALRPGGELRIVGNQHLAYHTKLQKIFGNHTVIASNPKFVVISATR